MIPDITVIVDKPVAEKKIVFTADEIREKNIESLSGLLQSAGIQLLAYGPYGLETKPSIRGFTDETVRVVIDGICVNNAQYGTFDFSSIDINSIEKIEIVKGGFTEGVSDEGAVGGVIYITTKKHETGQHIFSDTFVKSYLNVNALADTIGERFLYSGQISDVSFIKAGANLTFAQNRFLYNEKLYGNLTERLNADVLDGSGDFKYSQFFGEGYSFSVGELFYFGHKAVPGPEYGISGKQKDYDSNLSFNIRFPYLFDVLTLDSNLCWLSNTRFYESADENSKHFVNSLKLAVTGDYYANDIYSQSVGLTFDYTNLNSTNDGFHNQFEGALKETAKFKINDIFSFSFPFAFKFCNKNYSLVPKIGVKADFEYFAIMLDVYRMNQFPNMDDLYWIGDGFLGNPDLKPEDGWGGDVGFILKNLPIAVDVSIFANYYKNKIQWANDEEGWRPQNIASAFYTGCDISFSKDFFDKQLTLKGNVEYLYNRLLDKSNNLTYGNKIMWTPDFTAGLSAILNMDDYSINMEGNFVGSRYTSNINLYKMKPYLLVNVSGEIKCFDYFVPYFRVDNLLNTKYQAVENYPMPGISITLGSKFKFDIE